MHVLFITIVYLDTSRMTLNEFRKEQCERSSLPCHIKRPFLEAGFPTLLTHSQELTDKLFNQIKNDESHKLHQLLPSRNNNSLSLKKRYISYALDKDRETSEKFYKF